MPRFLLPIAVVLLSLSAPAALRAQEAALPTGTPASLLPPGAPVPPAFRCESSRIEKDGLVTLFYRVGHNRGAVLKPLLDRWKTPQGNIEHQEELHLLIITDTKENLPLLEKVLEILDRPDPQVLIETRVIEITSDEDFQFGLETSVIPRYRAQTGIDASRLASTFFQEITDRFNPSDYLDAIRTGGPGAAFFQGSTIRFATASTDNSGLFSFTLRALLEEGKAQILSNPRILVASGDLATIISGAEVPIQSATLQSGQTNISVVFKPVNITLTVRPHIVSRDFVHLEVNSQVQDIIATQDIQGTPTPIISTRSAQTNVTVKSGEMIVIGGLKRQRDLRTERGLPFLGAIPILGNLFKSTRRESTQSELIFYLRPILIDDSSGPIGPIVTPTPDGSVAPPPASPR